jgi:hypothetical protein
MYAYKREGEWDRPRVRLKVKKRIFSSDSLRKALPKTIGKTLRNLAISLCHLVFYFRNSTEA